MPRGSLSACLQARGFSGIWRLAGPEIRDAGARLESKPLRIIITYRRLDAGLFLLLPSDPFP